MYKRCSETYANLYELEEYVDVVVMGGGGAGLAAAVSAASRGARTVLLEKQATVGGTTDLAVGSITAAGTRLQASAGVDDPDLDAFIKDTRAFSPDLMHRDNSELRHVLATRSASTVAWLEKLGVVFAGPFPEPPHRIPRMHNAMPSARAYVDVLARAARTNGVTIVPGCEVTTLAQSTEGRVCGVRAQQGDADRFLGARHGVIIASGDFGGSDAMRNQYLTEAEARARPVNPTNLGDGIRLATQLGAETKNMDISFAPQFRFWRPSGRDILRRMPSWRWLMRLGSYCLSSWPHLMKPLMRSVLASHMSPSTEVFDAGCILVDAQGQRCDPPTPTELAKRPEVCGYIVGGASSLERLKAGDTPISTAPGIAYAYLKDYLRSRPDITRIAADEKELSRHLKLDPELLADAVRGLQPPFLVLGPVYAAMAVTEGGLAIDDCCRVLTTNGEVIPGLLAAGGAGQGGLVLKGHGLHLLWALMSGRLAGEIVTSTTNQGSAVTDHEENLR